MSFKYLIGEKLEVSTNKTTTEWYKAFYFEYLPFLTGILSFRFLGLESYLMRATASYLSEGLVVGGPI